MLKVPTSYTTPAEIVAYQTGWRSGHGIACHNVPQVGETYLLDSSGRVTADADNVREIHRDICHEVEMNNRDFSPFEFIAKEFNESEDPDNVWAAYEDGVADAIYADMKEYNDADYGINEEKV